MDNFPKMKFWVILNISSFLRTAQNTPSYGSATKNDLKTVTFCSNAPADPIMTPLPVADTISGNRSGHGHQKNGDQAQTACGHDRSGAEDDHWTPKQQPYQSTKDSNRKIRRTKASSVFRYVVIV